MSFRLFVDSSNGITLNPEYDYEKNRTKIENDHRTRDGSMFRYKWSAFDKFGFGVRYLNSSNMAIVNSWWESNTDLLFKDENSTEVFSLRLVNDSLPISKFIKPYDNLFSGVIELEGY